MVHTFEHSRVDMYAAPCFSGVFRHFPHYLLASLDYGSLIMLSMSSRKGRRVVRKMVLSGTEQGQGILRERELRRMFTLDAVPRTVMVQYNGCGPLAPFSADEGWEANQRLQKIGQAPCSFISSPFSADAERARTQGLASIGNLIQSLPAASPKTVTLAVALLDRFLLTETCRHFRAGLEASTPFSQMGLQAATGNRYRLHSPALRQAIPLACFVLACKHVETWSPVLAHVADLDSAFAAHCPCSSKDVHDAELHVIFTLDWNIDPLAAIDVAQKLLYMALVTGTPLQRAELRQRNGKELNLNLLVAALCKDLCRKPPGEIATACVLDACQRTGTSTAFVPSFLQPNSPEVLSTQRAISARRPHASPLLLTWLSRHSKGGNDDHCYLQK